MYILKWSRILPPSEISQIFCSSKLRIFHIYSTVFVKVYYVPPITLFSKFLQKFQIENMYNMVWWDEAYTVKKG